MNDFTKEERIEIDSMKPLDVALAGINSIKEKVDDALHELRILKAWIEHVNDTNNDKMSLEELKSMREGLT